MVVVTGNEGLATVSDRVGRLHRAPGAADLFGFFGHRFELRPPLPETQLQELEQRWRVRLPGDYRYFISQVGDGGAGPGYGLFPFGQHGDSTAENEPWDEWMVTDLEAPFSLADAWNLSEPDLSPPDLDDAAMEQWFERRDATYFDPALINGTIPIAHLGCAIWLRLVVTGPLAGQVWTDDRASDQGLYPACPREFTEWYLAWLTEQEAAVGLLPG